MTVSAPTTSPVLSVVFIVMMPLPPRDWMRYSSKSVRLPMPFSPATSKLASGTTTASATTSSLLLQPDAADADGGAALIAHFLLVKADAHAFAGDEHDLVMAAGQLDVDQAVALLDPDGDDAAFADVGEIGEVRFFTVPVRVAKTMWRLSSQV